MRAPRFIVKLTAQGKDDLTDEVQASTPALAAKMAEKSHEGYLAVRVLAIYAIVGRCTRCSGLIFDTDAPRIIRGRLHCGHCR